MNVNLEESIETADTSDEEEHTAQSVLQAIENAWLNEKFAPEILPHHSDLVDAMLNQLSYMEENMKRLGKGDLRFVIHKMELDRIRFVVSSYLRARLEKIERYTIHILSEEAERSNEESYLTPGELKFAKEYLASIETLFRTIALQHMPNTFHEFDVTNMAVKPNLESHVFLRANKTVTGILMSDLKNDEYDITAGSQHIMRYNLISDLVKNGDVQLI